MKNRPTLNILVPLVGLLALVASAAGLFWQDGGSPFTFTSLHGQAVRMYGQGLYRYDTLFTGAAFRGTDAVTIVVALPLLVYSYLHYRRGTLKGRFLLTGALSFFLYNSASMALSSALNNLFLLYIVFFSASFFAFVLAFTSIDLQTLLPHILPAFPRRGTAIFMFAAGLLPAILWLNDIIGPLAAGQVSPLLGSYTTMVTYALDLGLITPVVVLAGLLVLRRSPLGYVLASSMLILNVLVGAAIIGQTIFQIQAGISYSTGQFIGLVGSWVVMGLIAIRLVVLFFRNLSEAAVH